MLHLFFRLMLLFVFVFIFFIFFNILPICEEYNIDFSTLCKQTQTFLPLCKNIYNLILAISITNSILEKWRFGVLFFFYSVCLHSIFLFVFFLLISLIFIFLLFRHIVKTFNDFWTARNELLFQGNRDLELCFFLFSLLIFLFFVCFSFFYLFF